MTRAEWLALLQEEPAGHAEFEAKLFAEEMLVALARAGASERKLRLLCCAGVRRAGYRPDGPVAELASVAVEQAEEFADGRRTFDELCLFAEDWIKVVSNTSHLEDHDVLRAAFLCVSPRLSALDIALSDSWRALLARYQAAESLHLIPSLFREVFGYLHPSVTFDPNWRTSTAVALARQMYDSRVFSALPILADALQDAGCESEHVLEHCRGPGPHARGCWVVDLILGKE